MTRKMEKALLEKAELKRNDAPREEEQEETALDTEAAVKDEDTDLQFMDVLQVKDSRKDYAKYRPYFLHVPVDKVRKTFKNTTQFATNVVSGI
jgi:hypothetical protein